MLSAVTIKLYQRIKDLGLKSKQFKVTLPQLAYLVKRLKGQSEATITEVLGPNIKEAHNKVDLVINRTSTYDFGSTKVTAHYKKEMTQVRKAYEPEVTTIAKKMEACSNTITAYKFSPLQILTTCSALQIAYTGKKYVPVVVKPGEGKTMIIMKLINYLCNKDQDTSVTIVLTDDLLFMQM